VAQIEGEIVIERPVEEVFDFVADERNEPRFNPRMVHAELISEGPIGLGTRFRTELQTMGRTMPMTVEFTTYERPWRLGSLTRSSMMETEGELTFESAPGGTRMRWSWDVRPRGTLKLTAPFIGMIGRGQEQRIWGSLKRLLETQPAEEVDAAALPAAAQVIERLLPVSQQAQQLTAVLFVEIVEATPLAVSLGDRAWAELLEQYHQLVRDVLARHRGWLMDTAGDGFFAIFNEVADALRCALEIRESSRRLGLELRAGAHVGHCWNADDKCAGVDIHVGARLAGIADPGEVLLSEQAAERARRAGLTTTERGARSLKGLPGTWRVCAVGPASGQPVRS
jgi:class 3 adenylate cyclase